MAKEGQVLAIVGAGEGAMPIISKAKEMGIKVVAFGEGSSLAKNLVDIFVEKSIFDIDGMVIECEKHKVAGVIASSEVTTESAAYLADRLGLPGNEIINGFACRNKYVMRQRVSHLDSVSQPIFKLYSDNMKISYPVVIKAVDSCGKRGISLVKCADELEKAVNYAKENSSDNTVLVEEYISGGKEYSIECLVINGVTYIIQYTEKVTSGPPHFAEIAHHQPADLSQESKDKILRAASDILSCLGVRCGMAHLEIKIQDNKIYFIEVGARGGGDHIADTLVYLSTDFDYYKAAIKCSLGEKVECNIHNTGFSGIYFHCGQNYKYNKLFEKAKHADWCLKNTIVDEKMSDVSSNCEAVESGYFIYSADHKITEADAL